MNEATRIPLPSAELGASGEEFQNLHEFVRKARANLNQNAWDYIVGAAETETTLRRNPDRQICHGKSFPRSAGIFCSVPADTSHSNFRDGAEAQDTIRER